MARVRSPLQLERFLPYRLSVLSNTVSTAIAGAYHERFGLSIPEWRLLCILALTPNLSAAEVAQRTAMDKVAVSRAVAALLHTHRIERRTSRSDRRRSVLRLSKAGEHVYAQVAPFALAYEQELLQPLDAQDRESLDRILRILLGRATEMGPARDRNPPHV
ncbi:MAG TPA: MarR family winged helix-turn-helix transcriptional regulator [Steroidobacteraceae bacterium]|nr:MarR family winged helix-turn-helix transcriptional regulator [Steroidobacteraceae bacterium]